MRKNQFRAALEALGLLAALAFIILMPEVASGGMRSGLTLCAKAILPSLFPFFVCSGLLMRLGLCSRAARVLARPASAILRLPAQAGAAFLLGLVGGYPSGAQLIAGLYEKKQLNADEAEHALAVCNQAGPSFIFGVLGGMVFRSAAAGAFLYAVQLLAALIVCRLTGKTSCAEAIPKPDPPAESFAAAFAAAVQQAGWNVLRICMYVTVFSVLSAYALALAGPVLPDALRPAALGVLELSGGCAALVDCPLSVNIKLVLASMLLSFGGCCILMQTKAAVQEAGLSGQCVLPYKLLQAGAAGAVSLLLSLLLRVERWCAPVFAASAEPLASCGAGMLFVCTCVCLYLRKKYHSISAWEHV